MNEDALEALIDAIGDLTESIGRWDRLIDRQTEGPAKEGMKRVRDMLKANRERMKTTLAQHADDWFRVQSKKLRDILKKLAFGGIDDAFGATAKKAGGSLFGKVLGGLGKILGKLLGPILDILLNPKPTGGAWEERIVESVIIQNGDECYELQWYQGKFEDEMQWSEIRKRVKKVKCPEVEFSGEPLEEPVPIG